jgi:hypothetical protein
VFRLLYSYLQENNFGIGSKSNTIKNEGSAKERSNYTGEFPADNALELESKSSESNQSHAHMEDLNVN